MVAGRRDACASEHYAVASDALERLAIGTRHERAYELGQGLIDPLESSLLLAVNALGIDAQEDGHAVAGPFGHLRG